MWDCLDLIPVVGTIKDTCEFLNCLAHGDIKGAELKGAEALISGALDVVTFVTDEPFVEDEVKAALKGGMKGAKYAGAAVAKAALHAATNVAKTHTKTQLHETKKRDTKDPGDPPEEDTKKPSKRGEHVINNGVLRIYSDVVRRFASEYFRDNLDEMVACRRLSEQSVVMQTIRHPVPPNLVHSIRYNLVAWLDEPFVDTNSVAYGNAVQQLRNAFVSYMKILDESLHDSSYTSLVPGIERNIRAEVESFIASEVYVDKIALRVWLANNRGSGEYEEAMAAVASMLRKMIYHQGNDMVIKWVEELREAWR